MTDNKTLRDQVAEAIWLELDDHLPLGVRVNNTHMAITRAADAAIKAVLERMRCGACAWYNSTRCTFPTIVRVEDITHGCIHWEQK